MILLRKYEKKNNMQKLIYLNISENNLKKLAEYVPEIFIRRKITQFFTQDEIDYMRDALTFLMLRRNSRMEKYEYLFDKLDALATLLLV